MSINTSQLTQLKYIPHAKNNNPITSFLSAESVEVHLNERCGIVLDALRVIGSGTTKDIAPYTPYDSAEIGRRLSDLEKLGLVRPMIKDGELVIRKKCRVWEAI